MSTKEHRVSSLCAKRAFLAVLPSNRSRLKAGLGAQARMPMFRDSGHSRMKINDSRSENFRVTLREFLDSQPDWCFARG